MPLAELSPQNYHIKPMPDAVIGSEGDMASSRLSIVNGQNLNDLLNNQEQNDKSLWQALDNCIHQALQRVTYSFSRLRKFLIEAEKNVKEALVEVGEVEIPTSSAAPYRPTNNQNPLI